MILSALPSPASLERARNSFRAASQRSGRAARGLDALRRNGWKGHGPIPWSHPGNQGFLRCLAALARAAGAIGEDDEAARCWKFLADSSADAYAELSS